MIEGFEESVMYGVVFPNKRGKPGSCPCLVSNLDLARLQLA